MKAQDLFLVFLFGLWAYGLFGLLVDIRGKGWKMKNLKVPMPTGAAPPLDARIKARIEEFEKGLTATSELQPTTTNLIIIGRLQSYLEALQWVLRLLEGKDE